MNQLPILNNDFVEKEKYNLDLDFSPKSINTPVVHQMVTHILAGRRAGTACTKTKAEVRGGGKKPFKQKGTGRARQGSTRSPVHPGGGVPFGPKPRDFSNKMNRKAKNIAIHSVLADKFQAGRLILIDSISSNGKTKDFNNAWATRGIVSGTIITNDDNTMVLRATRNLRKINAFPVSGFSVYEVLRREYLIFEKAAFDKIINRVKGEVAL